jgi:hypothetical protein
MNREQRLEKILREMAPLFRSYLEDAGGCDHSVGICACKDEKILMQAEEILNTITFNGKEMTLPQGMTYQTLNGDRAGDYACVLYKGAEIVDDEQGYLLFISYPDGTMAEVNTLEEAKERIDKHVV